MADSRYKRVSRARPCLICGKTDWCSRTADDSISFCARVTAGADRLSLKDGWGVFYHDNLKPKPNWESSQNRRGTRKLTETISPAPLQIRDFVYSSLIRLSPASDYQVLTHGSKGLLERGLENTQDYGGLPGTVAERKDLAAKVRLLLNQNFPLFLRQNPLGLRHVPGFWIDEFGDTNLWQQKDFANPFLLIPYRSPAGLIQACQIRLTGKLAVDTKRYLWLSLPQKNSTGSGTPLHFASWKKLGKSNFSDLPVLVTEGALKADVVAGLRPDFFAVANGGVNCSHDLIVTISHGKMLYLAFDSDYLGNPVVLRQLAKLILLRNVANDSHLITDNTKLLSWDCKFKGIDDALLNNSDLEVFSINEWVDTLSVDNRLIVNQTIKAT